MFARLVLVFVVELGTACAPGTPDRASLQRDAASTLRMTDAVELLHFGGDNQMTLDGPIDAWDGYFFGVQVSPEEVFAFYEKELAGLGWRVDPLSNFILTTETRATAWCSPLRVFRIGITKDRAFAPEFYRGQQFRTVYEASITARQPGSKCPLLQ